MGSPRSWDAFIRGNGSYESSMQDADRRRFESADEGDTLAEYKAPDEDQKPDEDVEMLLQADTPREDEPDEARAVETQLGERPPGEDKPDEAGADERQLEEQTPGQGTRADEEIPNGQVDNFDAGDVVLVPEQIDAGDMISVPEQVDAGDKTSVPEQLGAADVVSVPEAVRRG